MQKIGTWMRMQLHPFKDISYSLKNCKTWNQTWLYFFSTIWTLGLCRIREDPALWSTFSPAARKELILALSFWTQHREWSFSPSQEAPIRPQMTPSLSPAVQAEASSLLPPASFTRDGQRQEGARACSFSSTSLLLKAAAAKSHQTPAPPIPRAQLLPWTPPSAASPCGATATCPTIHKGISLNNI